MATKQGFGSLQTDSDEIVADMLDLFRPPEIETQLISGKTVDVNLVNAISDDGPFEFNIQSSDVDYLYLPLTRLRGCIQVKKVVDNVETVCASGDDYSCISMLSNSLFKQCEVLVNGVDCMDQSSSNYAYKSYLETLLRYIRK